MPHPAQPDAAGGALVTPYYDADGITLYHADMRDVLPALYAADLIVTDPPYVVGLALSVWETNKVGGWPDLMNAAVWYGAWLAECRRLTAVPQGAAWVFNSWRSFPALARGAYEARWAIQSLLVWDKQHIGPAGLRGLRPRYEVVALFAQRRFAIADRTIPDICASRWPATRKPTGHPAEKPVTLLRHLIQISGGELVLDPFTGSGSTLVAAKQLGRRAVGIELEERWCELAAGRLEATVVGSAVRGDLGRAEVTG